MDLCLPRVRERLRDIYSNINGDFAGSGFMVIKKKSVFAFLFLFLTLHNEKINY